MLSPFNASVAHARPPLTATGALRSTVVPSPSWPDPLAPQHHALPVPTSTPQVWLPPAVSVAHVRPPLTATSVVLPYGQLWAVVPSPSWPFPFPPQHHALPVPASTPQVWAYPAARDANGAPGPAAARTPTRPVAETGRVGVTVAVVVGEPVVVAEPVGVGVAVADTDAVDEAVTDVVTVAVTDGVALMVAEVTGVLVTDDVGDVVAVDDRLRSEVAVNITDARGLAVTPSGGVAVKNVRPPTVAVGAGPASAIGASAVGVGAT